MKLFRGALFRVMQCFNTAKFAALESRDLHDATHIKLSDTVQLEEFEPYIKETLKRELDQKSKALWVHLNQSNLGLLPMLCNNEFKIHHGFDSKVVLYRWLRQEEDMVPIFSRFYVAAGAVVIKDGRLLMVQEKNVRLNLRRKQEKMTGECQVDCATSTSHWLTQLRGNCVRKLDCWVNTATSSSSGS